MAVKLVASPLDLAGYSVAIIVGLFVFIAHCFSYWSSSRNIVKMQMFHKLCVQCVH